MLVDTHCHLSSERFYNDYDEVIKRAQKAGVSKMIIPGTSEDDSKRVLKLAKQYLGIVYGAVGVHPEEIGKTTWLKELIKENKEWVVAVGEIGTDKNTEELRSTIREQKEMFRAQCEIALEYDLPVIVHTRDSMKETLEVLDQLPKMPRGHFHCWSDSDEMLEEVLARGFYVGFCGNVTYKNNQKLQEQAKRVPANRLLLETDSPYLPPAGHRGERNEPINVKITAEFVADLRGDSLKALAKITTENAERLYKI